MNLNFIYMIKQKSTGIPIQNIFLSRSEARENKRMFELRDGEKYSIIRFQKDKTIR